MIRCPGQIKGRGANKGQKIQQSYEARQEKSIFNPQHPQRHKAHKAADAH